MAARVYLAGLLIYQISCFEIDEEGRLSFVSPDEDRQGALVTDGDVLRVVAENGDSYAGTVYNKMRQLGVAGTQITLKNTTKL